MSNTPGEDQREREEFEAAAGESHDSFLGEFIAFLKENKKWWLAPMLVVFALLTLIAILGGTGAAPFIYSLF